MTFAEGGTTNLEVVYQAYGDDADLYRDVLKLSSPKVTSEEIQMAYFDRRSELFTLLANIDAEETQDEVTASHRFHVERQMDAVVMAVRILGNNKQRSMYDAGKLSSSQQQQQQQQKKKSQQQQQAEPDGEYRGRNNNNKNSRHVKVVVPPPPTDTSTINDSFYTEDETTVISEWTEPSVRRALAKRKAQDRNHRHRSSGVLSNAPSSSIITKIQEEVAGTFEDTLVSFEQVFSVFTLQEDEIVAVMGRIDKAKKQLTRKRR